MLTAAVRDLMIAHPDKYEIDVRSACSEIWENNPYITPISDDDSEVRVIECNYPLIHKSNTAPYHFIHGFRKYLEEELKVSIPATEFKGDIYLTEEEKNDTWLLDHYKIETDFWLIFAGGKYDFTAKWWNPAEFQAVVDTFQGEDKITFVQCGEKSHWHPVLYNVVNVIGETNLRELMILIYHSVGVVCPITFAMHAAAAIPMKTEPPKNRPCVVIAGGREPAQWEQYPHHRFLSTNGALDCCDNGGCWKSRCQRVGDGDEKDENNLCIYPVEITEELSIPKCMEMITAEHVVDAIDMYYKGGVLKYNNQEKIKHKTNQTGAINKMSTTLFKPRCLEEAKEMVVGSCNGVSAEARWELETPLFAKAIKRQIEKIGATEIVDYGCGCGRLAKAVIDDNPYIHLTGVDASQEFLQSAREYVSNERFIGIRPKYVKESQIIYSTYVFQHIPAIELRDALYRIWESIGEHGLFINCCSYYRMAMNFKTNTFFDDSCLGVDLEAEFARMFDIVEPMFTEEEFAENEILRKMVLGENGKLPHPANVFKRKDLE